jgi:PAS domain S-box-containing protein
MGVRGKLVWSTLLITLLIGAVLIHEAMDQQRMAVAQEIQRRADFLARHVSGILGERAVTLQSINDAQVMRSIAGEPGVLAAMALDPEGWVLCDGTDRDHAQKQRPPGFEILRDAMTPEAGPVVRASRGVISALHPVVVDGRHHGYALLLLSEAGIREDSTAALGHLIRLLAVLMVAGVMVAFAVSITVRRPLVLMAEAARAMKAGNFKVRVPVRHRDELGALAQAINDVAASLRATTVSKRYLDEVLQSMVDTLIVVDTEATIVTVNRATLDLLGYAEGELVGQPASLICIDEGYQLTGARLNHLLGDRTQQDYELMYRTSGGAQLPISFSGSPIRDNSGEVVGYVCIGKDISERKRNETERDRLHKKLVDTSRRAGMAEVATGVLHNVGNVLNSVNMSASLVVDTVKRSKVSGLTKAVGLLQGQEADLGRFVTEDEKGRQLPRYLGEVARHLQQEQSVILKELESLTHNINHIKDIIAMQQSYSRVRGVIETLSLRDILDEALRMNEASLESHRIRLEREYGELPLIKTDKHKVLQILVNLVTNAKDALEKIPEAERRITLRLRSDDSMAHIEVQDYGEGISQENLTRIFTHGFTTKKRGNGFGLHSAALTAKELRGSLLVFSEGPGRGATFTLSLPLQMAEAKG